MLAFLYYCLKVIVCSGVLYGYYLLALRNNRFHQWNRWYLLASVILAFSVPLLRVPIPDFFESEPEFVYGGEGMTLPAFAFAKQDTGFHFTLPLVATFIYVSIVIFLLLLLAKNIWAIRRLKHHYLEETIAEIHFYNTAEPGTPFSFFKNIFWNNSIDLHTEKGNQMLRHEMAHVTEMHSADKIFLQLLAAFAFWNPFLYLVKKELSVVHEFIADQKASAGDDQLQYASLLLTKALGSQQFALGNPFFHSQLKRRLIMLTTNKNPRFSYLRRLLVLPLAAISLILFSFKYKEIKDKQKTASPTYTTTVAEEEFYGDTSKAKFYVQLNKTYKGSTIESIMPTTDMSGAVVKTTDDKTYFLDRLAAAKEFNFIITDSGFTAPPGAVLVTGTTKTTAKNGANIRMSPNSPFPQYPFTIDTTAIGLSQALASNSKRTTISVVPNEDMHINVQMKDVSLDMNQKDLNTKGLENTLVMVDGVKIEPDQLKELDLKSIESMEVFKGKSATDKYGTAGNNGAILITTKAKRLLPANPLYLLDGTESTKEIVDHILPENIRSVAVLKGEDATKAYGEKGKNGVVLVSTTLAKNEVTFSEENKGNKPTERVVIGHRVPNDSSATKLTKQPESLKEVVVVGYETKPVYEKVFTKVDNPASFPGGLDGWRRYLEHNLQYPNAAQEKGTQGTVRVQMTVDETGNITSLKALNEPGNGLAEEAVRVISKGPKWVPATQNGHPVTYRFVQNLTFQLQ